jgi:glycosylphosphatidylinositol transamidase (GPIT) subunit GPI8
LCTQIHKNAYYVPITIATFEQLGQVVELAVDVFAVVKGVVVTDVASVEFVDVELDVNGLAVVVVVTVTVVEGVVSTTLS